MKQAKVGKIVMMGLAIGLAVAYVGPAQSQCKSPLPGPSDLLFGWNDEKQNDWGGDPGPVMNTDRQFATEGIGSAMVDFTDQPTWADRTFVLDFPEPQDWSKYGFVSVDVFTPDASIGVDDQGMESGWN